MQTDYERIILGATFAGLGAAASHPEDCLVVERRSQPGYEYIGSLSTIPCNRGAKSVCARELEQQLRAHGILSESGRIAHGALASFIDAFILQKHISVLLQTEVFAVTEHSGYYEVDLVNSSGLRRITAKEVFYAQSPVAGKTAYVSALLAPPCTEVPLQPWMECMVLEQGYYDGQIILKVRVDGNASMQKARLKLLDCWRARPAQYSDWRIAVFAEELDVFYGQTGAVDFLTAFDRAEQTPLLRTEKQLQTYDLIVVGLGTAGAMAAITAARMGLSVLGLERLSVMGGTSTAGVIQGYYFGSLGGAYEQLDEKTAEVQKKDFAFRTPAREAVWEQAATEAGAELIYNAVVVDVIEDSDRIYGVHAVTDREFISVRGRYVLDCTGEGEVCVCAGCDYTTGRTMDQQMQPYTRLETRIAGSCVYGTANVDFGRVNVCDAADITHHLLWSGAHFVKPKITPKDKDYSLVLSPMLGVREGKLIACEQMISKEKLFENYEEPQTLFYSYADLDKHGWDLAFEEEMLCDWAVAANLGAVNVSAAVPLAAMIPLGKEGLLVAGRCMGMDHVMASCVRMQRDMQKAGEAIAVAVYLAVRDDVSIKEVSYAELSGLLRKSGCLNEANNIGFAFDAPSSQHAHFRQIVWMTDVSEIQAGLSGDSPGVAIWSCKRLGRSAMESILTDWLDSRCENLRKHSAIALALMNCAAGEALLLDMVKTRDPKIMKDCRKHNQIRGVMAIYALRRLRSSNAIDELSAIVTGGEKEFARSVYRIDAMTTRYHIEGYNDVYFQFLSHAVCALLSIRSVHIQERDAIDRVLETFLKDDYIGRIVPGKTDGCEYQMAQNIAYIVRRQLQIDIPKKNYNR